MSTSRFQPGSCSHSSYLIPNTCTPSSTFGGDISNITHNARSAEEHHSLCNQQAVLTHYKSCRYMPGCAYKRVQVYLCCTATSTAACTYLLELSGAHVRLSCCCVDTVRPRHTRYQCSIRIRVWVTCSKSAGWRHGTGRWAPVPLSCQAASLDLQLTSYTMAVSEAITCDQTRNIGNVHDEPDPKKKLGTCRQGTARQGKNPNLAWRCHEYQALTPQAHRWHP